MCECSRFPWDGCRVRSRLRPAAGVLSVDPRYAAETMIPPVENLAMPRPSLLLSIVLVSCLGPVEPARAPNERLTKEPVIADLSFLEGTWLGSDGESSWESMYSSPSAGQVLGASKEMRGGHTVMIDFEHFYVREGQMRMTPYPFGTRSVEFTLSSFDESQLQAVFENPEHDFPQRFTYRRVSDDNLRIELTGEMSGAPVMVVLEFQLVAD